MTARRCHACGHWTCTAVCLLLASGTTAPVVAAQAAGVPRATPIGNSAAVAIGGMFLVTPAAPQVMPTTFPCGEAQCFEGTATVRANQPWQLQLRLDPSAMRGRRVTWDGTGGVPAVGEDGALLLTREALLGAGWVTIVVGTAPTAGTSIALRLRVSSLPGERDAIRADPVPVAAALEYRVIGYP